jgi:hypothetical protein
MNKQHTALCVLALGLLGAGALHADPFMTSLPVGPQTPDPIARGGTATYSITVTKTNSGGIDAYLTIPDLPQGATASFSPNPIKLSSGSTTGTATLTVSTTGDIAPGPHTFSVVATDGGSHNTLTNTATLDVALNAPGLVRLSDGSWCFAFATEPGKTYSIQASASCLAPDWTTLCTTNCGTNNLTVFIDRDKSTCPSRFYRSVPQ